MSSQQTGPELTTELRHELGELTARLTYCRDRLDRLRLHAAAADTNQAIERLQTLIRARPPG